MEIFFTPNLLGFVPVSDYPPELTANLDYLMHDGARYVRRVDVEALQQTQTRKNSNK